MGRGGHDPIIELISATTTQTGMKVTASYDPNWYPKGVKITDAQLKALPLQRHDWHGDWNYTLTAAARNVKSIPRRAFARWYHHTQRPVGRSH